MKRTGAFLILLSSEALLAFLGTFLTPSESGHALFLGLSSARLVLSAFMVLMCVGLLGLTIHFWRSNDRWAAALRRLDSVCLDQGLLGPWLVTLLVVPLLVTAAVLKVVTTPIEFAAYRTWAPDTFPLLHAVVVNTLPLLSFLVLVALQSAALLALRYRRAFTRETWDWKRLGPSLLVVLIVSTTLAHWLILGFQLRFLVDIPAWYWKFEPLPFSIRDAWFALGVGILLAVAYGSLLLKRRIILGLTCVFLLGWFLQIGVGIMSGAGFDSIRERYFSTYHRAYVLKASQDHASIADSIQRYEEIYGSHAFTSTKPPGLMAFYIALDHLVNGYPPAFTDVVRYERLSQAISLGFPLLAASMVFLLYAFLRHQLATASALVAISACVLYVLGPGVVLFSLFADQAVYPLVFLLGIWLAVTAIQRRSLVWAFSLGIFLYLAVFFAFTMLPLLPFVGLYLVLYDGQDRSPARGWQRFRMAAAIGAGVLLLWLIFGASLHYNFLPRFERTMAINHNFDFYLRVGNQPPTAPETVFIRLGQIVNAAWVNNLDFAASIGFAIYILFLVQAVRLVVRLFARRLLPGDIIPVSLLLTFIVLNAAGTAQGEVPRLWLFWLPMVVLLASFELEPHLRRRPSILLWLALAEFVTVVLTFHFQDLRM